MSHAMVVHGPAVWRDLQGEIVWGDVEWVVVRLESRDDAGNSTYEVRMPRSCIVEMIEDPLA